MTFATSQELQAGILKSKISELQSALFFNESNSIVKLPTHVIADVELDVQSKDAERVTYRKLGPGHRSRISVLYKRQLGVERKRGTKGREKNKVHCRNSRPLTIACHMKTLYLDWPLFIGADDFVFCDTNIVCFSGAA